MANRNEPGSEIEMDDAVWKELPAELVEKCLLHLPVLTIASTLRAVSKTWRDLIPGTAPFMKLWKDIDNYRNSSSGFGFLMHGTNILSHRCETVALDHKTLKWQAAPTLPHRACKAESVSEGILCLSSQSFIVWNPLLPASCKLIVPRMIPARIYSTVSLVVDRATASFKILAFTPWFQECHTYSSTTRSWDDSHSYEGPEIYVGLVFPEHRDRGRLAVAYDNCVYVAVADHDVHKVGDLCYDVKRNVWKPAVMCTLSPEIMKLYNGNCFTRSLFVISDVMYMVVEYLGAVHLRGNNRPRPTVQILARTVAPVANNAGKWTVIATTLLPQRDWETKLFGTWYGSILEGDTKPTICGLFKSEPHLFLMMYSIGSCTWKTVCVTDQATRVVDGSQDTIGRCKWLSMKMVPHYEPSWICPAAGSGACQHNEISGQS